jgi:dsRNA-specific ribonuclease
LGTPVYRVVKTEGLPHERTFSVEAVWETGSSNGEGASIKSAEMMAARDALETLCEGDPKSKPSKPARRTAKEKNEHI